MRTHRPGAEPSISLRPQMEFCRVPNTALLAAPPFIIPNPLIHKNKYRSSKHSDLWHCVKFCVQCIWVSKSNQMLDVANKTAHFFDPLLLNCNRQAYSLPNYIKFVIQGWIPCSVWKNKQAQVESRVDIEDLARVMIQKVLFRASIEKISKKRALLKMLSITKTREDLF